MWKLAEQENREHSGWTRLRPPASPPTHIKITRFSGFLFICEQNSQLIHLGENADL